jgi:hypothetical protein
MSLKLQLASKDGVPEGLAQFVKTDGNATILELPDGWGIDNVSGLRSKNSELLGEVRQLKSKLDPIKDLDPSDVQAKLARLAELEAQPPGSGIKAIEEARKQLESQYRKDLDQTKAEVLTLREERKRAALAQAEAQALRESKHKPLPGVEYLLREHLSVLEEDGQLHVVVVDPASRRPRVTTKPGGSGYMRADELIEELATNERFGHLFQGNGKVGAGVTGRNGAAVPNPWMKGQVNVTKQLELMSTNPDLANQLKAQAASSK